MNLRRTICYASGLMGILLLVGCSGGEQSALTSSNTTSGSVGNPTESAVAKMSINITDSNQNVVYSDSIANSTLNLVGGQSYTLTLAAPGAPSNTAYTLTMTQTNVPNGVTITQNLIVGANTLSIAAQGDYTMTLAAAAGADSPAPKTYQANVSCAQPTFTKSSLTPSGISAVPNENASGSANLYDFSAVNVVAHANGMAPYVCAWDLTGVGIVDTSFVDCNQILSAQYVNYVNTLDAVGSSILPNTGSRQIGLIVKDSCNTTYTVSNAVALSYPTYQPGNWPGFALGNANVFISGQISKATGSAVNDARVDGVTYLATNEAPNYDGVVQSNLSGSSFEITSYLNYGQLSSKAFGMDIKVGNITGTVTYSVDDGTIVSTLNANQAVITSISYSTDQAGDADPATTFSGTGANCVLSNQGVIPQQAGGAGSCGTANPNQVGVDYTVEVYGHYVCTGLMSANGAMINISGDFDGLTTQGDTCPPLPGPPGPPGNPPLAL